MNKDIYKRQAFEAYMLHDFNLTPEQLLLDPETGEYDRFEVQDFWLVWRRSCAESAARAGV